MHGNITFDRARQIVLEWMKEIAKGKAPYGQKLEDKIIKSKLLPLNLYPSDI